MPPPGGLARNHLVKRRAAPRTSSRVRRNLGRDEPASAGDALADYSAEQRRSAIGRIAALAAVALAIGAMAWVLLSSSDSYTVKAQFQSAAQLVKGNVVKMSGRSIGVVKDIELTHDGEAELTLEIEDDFAPLRKGTKANARIASLSGVANRYVDLHVPSGKPPPIEDGGVITQDDTTAQVDLDQLFDLFDKKTRRGLTRLIRGFGTQYGARGVQQNLGWRYLNPSLVASRRLFNELNRDTSTLEDFLVENSRLVTDLADKRQDLSKLIDELADFTGALARERTELARAISELPPFMRRANSTFVNLRGILDEFDPLVAETRPVAPKLRQFLAELRPFARDAKPTIRDLAQLVRRRGKDNDLYELSESTMPFRDIAIGPVQANGKQRPGSFETSTRSLRQQTPHWASARPYAVDLTGWFDDFSHTGIYDGNGSAARVAANVNAFTFVNGQLTPVPVELRQQLFNAVATLKQLNRCPGANERDPGDGSVPWRESGLNCDPTQVMPGP